MPGRPRVGTKIRLALLVDQLKTALNTVVMSCGEGSKYYILFVLRLINLVFIVIPRNSSRFVLAVSNTWEICQLGQRDQQFDPNKQFDLNWI